MQHAATIGALGLDMNQARRQQLEDAIAVATGTAPAPSPAPEPEGADPVLIMEDPSSPSGGQVLVSPETIAEIERTAERYPGAAQDVTPRLVGGNGFSPWWLAAAAAGALGLWWLATRRRRR